MALKEMAPILLRPHRAALVAATVADAARGGRLRRPPAYIAPSDLHVTRSLDRIGPLHQLRLGFRFESHHQSGAPPRGRGGFVPTLSSEPAIDEPAGASESTVPSLGSPDGVDPLLATERPARARPQGVDRRRARSRHDPLAIGEAAKPGQSVLVVALDQGPCPPGPGLDDLRSGRRPTDVRAASATGRVRQVSTQERLRPFLGESESNELFYPSKADRPWQYIVLHHSASTSGNYDQIDAEHRKVLGYDGCGYHFVIGNGTGSADGQIEVAQRWVKQKHGVHCRNAKSAEIDEYGIGICFIGDLDKEPPTPRQVAAAKALIAYLGSRYSISRSRVETHAHLAATPTVCPGRYFPTQSLIARRRCRTVGHLHRSRTSPRPGGSPAGRLETY